MMNKEKPGNWLKSLKKNVSSHKFFAVFTDKVSDILRAKEINIC